MNLYGYVLNDPINMVDPNGLETITLGGSVRVPSWAGKLIFGDDFTGQGFSGGLAISFPGLAGGEFDAGSYVTAHGGGADYGTGRYNVNAGFYGGSVCDLAGEGREVSANYKLVGGSASSDANHRFTGGALQVGPGYNIGGSGTLTSVASVRRGVVTE